MVISFEIGLQGFIRRACSQFGGTGSGNTLSLLDREMRLYTVYDCILIHLSYLQ
jgi:hypothetical protein